MENNPEIVNYIKNVGKELAHAVKKDPNVINFLKNPITEFFNPNENRARVRSVGYSKDLNKWKKESESTNIYVPFNLNIINKFLDRKKDDLIKKNKNLDILKSNVRIEEEKIYKMKPQITKQSKKILESKYADKKPIYERTKEILNLKSSHIKNLKSLYAELNALKEEKTIENYKKPGHFDKTRFIEWRNQREEWEKRRIDKIEKIKKEIENLETQSFKHHPKIDINSDKIAKSKIVKEESKRPVYNKLYNLHHEKAEKYFKMTVKSMPTFSPRVNDKLPYFLHNVMKKNKQNILLPNSDQCTSLNYNTCTKFFLNRSLELKDFSLPKNEKILLETNNSRNKMNSSMRDCYNKTNNISNKDEDNESYLISRYRLALELGTEKMSDLQKSKFRANNSFNDSDCTKYIPWQTRINFVNKKIIGKEDEPANSLYKINIRNNSACDKNKENVIILKNKFSNQMI